MSESSPEFESLLVNIIVGPRKSTIARYECSDISECKCSGGLQW